MINVDTDSAQCSKTKCVMSRLASLLSFVFSPHCHFSDRVSRHDSSYNYVHEHVFVPIRFLRVWNSHPISARRALYLHASQATIAPNYG